MLSFSKKREIRSATNAAAAEKYIGANKSSCPKADPMKGPIICDADNNPEQTAKY